MNSLKLVMPSCSTTVARGATRVALQADRRGSNSVLTVQVDGAGWDGDPERAGVWEKVFARGGARIDFPPAGTQSPLVFTFEAR